MLKVVINYPSEISLLTVGHNINQTVTEIFITIFFAFLSDLSHIKIALLLGRIVRAEFKFSSPTGTPLPLGLHQHFDKLVSRNDAPLAKNDLFNRDTKKLASLSLNV